MEGEFGNDFTKLPRERYAPGSRFMKAFELIKAKFGSSGSNATNLVEETLPLRLKNSRRSARYDASEDEIKLRYLDMYLMIAPVVEQIINLVRTQIDDATSGNLGMISVSIMCWFDWDLLLVDDSPGWRIW
jgi:hypothetical protein